MKYCAYVCLFFLFAMSARISFAEKTLSFDKESVLIEYCNDHDCMKIKPPKSLLEYINDGYTVLKFKEFPSGHYILATLGDSLGGNVCYISYKMSGDEISLSPVNILPENRQLCIYKVKGEELINSYRDGGKWYDEIYKYKDKGYHLLAIDECVGCGVVFRKEYLPNIEKYHLWVTDDKHYYKRVPFILEVNKKSFIFPDNNEGAATHMYLIAGDKVNILDENDAWVKVRFKNPKVGYVIGWILKENTNYETLIP